MKRSIYLTEQNERLLALVMQETSAATVSAAMIEALKHHASVLGFKYVPGTWVKGGE